MSTKSSAHPWEISRVLLVSATNPDYSDWIDWKLFIEKWADSAKSVRPGNSMGTTVYNGFYIKDLEYVKNEI